MRYGVSTILIGIFVTTVFTSTPISLLLAQELCEVRWYGPDDGDSITVRPGNVLWTVSSTRQGGNIEFSSSTTVTFRGRTGERTFELERLDTTHPFYSESYSRTQIYQFFFDLDEWLHVGFVRFRVLELKGSQLKIIILGHPEPKKMGICSQ